MKDEKRALVPRLRFPEFSGEWKYKELSSFLESFSERVDAAENEFPVYSSTRDGLRFQRDYYDGRELVNEGAYGIVPQGYFVYRHMSDDTIFVFNLNDTGGKVAVSKEYPVFKAVGINPHFLLHKLNGSLEFKKFAESQRKGGTRTRLYFKTLCSWRNSLPGLQEQQKIADCLSSLDALIAAQADKIDALKTHKKGLMQQLFPREGETVPRLRFPEFRDAGEWGETTLGKVVDIRSGYSPSRYNLSGEARYPFLKVEDLNNCEKYQASSRVYSNDSLGVVPPGSIIFPKRGAAILNNKVRLNTVEVLMDTNLMAITSRKDVLAEFLYCIVVTEGLSKIADTSTIPQINNKHIIPYVVRIPGKAEQQEIADCLSSIDELIAAHTEKFEALKVHKKGLMQQLFPSPEAVSA
ncbi:hypothetical protein HOP54_09500 [Halomonas daqingensis]|uniref:Type I restriction modification DNA specificity domain-containing protein n=1 Tax=Billgrantia desiderata TaxID=52021 RepID=A0ABS9B401_9GAMM|nr:restriction endonuclease subunit S [Halomonas desiderata]MCE8013420.1 hypothetical protein [Halomonas desiderata]MCE8028925.1 hypothetical protein [Halomonas desiderata]MCE8042140.1 hypothetical protein [Halomonas desiderata]MCE8046715.1 hypothetical protein [Halomonas desiderata]